MALFVFLLILFAVFAWLISWGMVKILFYPKKSIHFLGIHWEAPIVQWAKTLQWQQLIPADQLPKQLDQLLPVIDGKLDDFFRNRLTQKLPMIAMFIGDKTIQQLKEVFIEELQNMFPDLLQAFGKNIQETIVDQFEQKSLPIIEQALLKATAPLRKLAIVFGMIWGSIFYIIWSIIQH